MFTYVEAVSNLITLDLLLLRLTVASWLNLVVAVKFASSRLAESKNVVTKSMS